jgi:hypothetical protein
MKIKIRPEDTSRLRENGWFQPDGWLAELRDDGGADPPGDAHAGPDGVSGPWPEALAAADALAEARARAQAAARAHVDARAQADARAEARARAQADARAQAEAEADARAQAEAAARAEVGSCISWHADPAALGEADTRARAIGAGWRIDAFGRLACPRCQQTDPGFWATGPVVPWDRYTAVARAARAAGRGDGTAAAWGSSGDPGRVAGGYPRVGPPEPGRHQ